jgi:hypothetical protein
MKLHCTSCPFTCTTSRDGMKHVAANPAHTVMGEGADPGTTILITADREEATHE